MEELMFRGPRSLMRARAWLQWLHLFLLSALTVAWMRSSRDSSRHAVGVIIDAWQLQWMLLWPFYATPAGRALSSGPGGPARPAEPGEPAGPAASAGPAGPPGPDWPAKAEFALYNANSAGVCVI